MVPEQKPDTVEVQYGLDHVYDRPSSHVNRTTLSVPMVPDVKRLETCTVTMHLSPTLAYDMGDEYSEWFSRRLGYPVKLLLIVKDRRKVLGNMGQGVSSGSASHLYSLLASIPIFLVLHHASIQTAPPRIQANRFGGSYSPSQRLDSW